MTMPKDTASRTTSRQRPVSCRFCRSRKLRCSRDAPCSNCISRGITCDLEIPVAAPSDADTATKNELLDRIQKLEELVKHVGQTHQQPTPSSDYIPENVSERPQVTAGSLSPQVEPLDRDAAWLESIYDNPNRSTDEFHPEKVLFRVCSVQNLDQAQQTINNNDQFPNSTYSWRRYWMPDLAEAKILLDKFLEEVEPLHHVIYRPSISTLLARVYCNLANQKPLKSGEIILLLSIFASASHSWSHSDCSARGMYSCSMHASKQAAYWMEATEDLIDYAHRTTRVSIEGVQGIVIAMFVLIHVDCFAPRCRHLISTGLLLGRELGLHCIDHPSNAALAHTIQAEMGRRVWWYLVACDWVQATKFNGMSRGVYWTHQRHMMTNEPLNLDDEDLVDGMPLVGRPLSQPTSMSYSLYRIKLATISRHIVDRTPILAVYGGAPSYDVVMDIDTELKQLLDETPPYFNMSTPEIVKTYLLSRSKAASISMQALFFNSIVHGSRCKLHLPFFSRGFKDPEYAASRDICIESARRIIQSEKGVGKTYFCSLTPRGLPVLNPMGLIKSVFMACIVLLMDLCQSQTGPEQYRRRKQWPELLDAFRLLRNARSESDLAAEFLDSMEQVLHRHGLSIPRSCYTQDALPDALPEVPPPEHNAPNPTAMEGVTTGVYNDFSVMTTPSNCPNMANNGFLPQPSEPQTDDFAQMLGQSIGLGNIDWDDIFIGLDNFP
ncbi:hypothetical protein K491DRAFT_676493 [Lophiostoma macrostomum CBS 122681]|uniref:Zn(2)-C6 fungal-type domain-containing protein n=1 Tax=Lophiostoma macrostomum CBS 122681 TaxID=1314788 RepID=A0A6A6TEN7_9PLEO|nr:hypothetical protein K491DRAFT_676493 [Lophiostoma macrostomum CBS 122681]